MKNALIYLGLMLGFSLAVAGVHLYRDRVWNGKPTELRLHHDVSIDSTKIKEHLRDSIAADLVRKFLETERLPSPTERELAVQKCGSCHPKEYQAELDGPHANAFKRLQWSYHRIMETELYPSGFRQWVSTNIGRCAACHTGQDIFQVNLKGTDTLTALHHFSPAVFPDQEKFAQIRPDHTTWSTGVDCFTCHYDGKNVIADASFTPDPKNLTMEGYCNPKPSLYLNSNMACSACHGIQLKFVQAYSLHGLNTSLKSPETNCVKCHQTYDNQGKGTHYYPWRHGDLAKHPQKSIKGGMFEALNTQTRISGDSLQLVIDWVNDQYPHNFSECGEIVVVMDLFDSQRKPIGQKTIRVNRKLDHDHYLVDQMSGQAPTGVVGYPYYPHMEPLHEIVHLGKAAAIKHGYIEITAIDKAQYWAKDEAGDTIYRTTRKF